MISPQLPLLQDYSVPSRCSSPSVSHVQFLPISCAHLQQIQIALPFRSDVLLFQWFILKTVNHSLECFLRFTVKAKFGINSNYLATLISKYSQVYIFLAFIALVIKTLFSLSCVVCVCMYVCMVSLSECNE